MATGGKKMRKNNWACFLLILAGIVIGGSFISFPIPSLSQNEKEIPLR